MRIPPPAAPAPQRRPRLSAFVCARNEEAELADCLRNLRFADEIVVLLDRSTDGSAAIAERLADRVIEGEFPLEGPRRAAALAACSGDWVLEIDADERVTPALAAEIRAIAAAPARADWYLVPVDNFIGGRRVRHGWGGSFGTSAVARLYRPGAKSWGEERVHPGARLQGRSGGRLQGRIEHFVDRDISAVIRRLDRYTLLRAADLQRGGGARHGLASHAFRGLRRFWKCYVTRRGYREGEWGVLIALMAALYPLLSELRARIEAAEPADPRPAPGAADASALAAPLRAAARLPVPAAPRPAARRAGQGRAAA
ncbi:glycosyltransferase family 2 protein [Roseicella frigidaeris]|uniref:Glycosyltransferase family 2 protein n=1 Tax=Roseicella frigidaeris TaxID=2230885 RepID=A0A327M4D8_9PROT|nr:glycosyltransferase family 2 protein [Roseicella frigidaeris]RAI57164.1 glycosyltransferase family 2 protein [Roseicella frigidaeris]